MSKEDDTEFDPLDALLADEVSPALPVGPGGTFAPMLPVQPEPIPEATPETMICLRGPCYHYVEIISKFNAGNAKGTLDHDPKQINRFCSVIRGAEIDLTDQLVYDCNSWDPRFAGSEQTLFQIKRQKEKEAWLEEYKETNKNE